MGTEKRVPASLDARSPAGEKPLPAAPPLPGPWRALVLDSEEPEIAGAVVLTGARRGPIFPSERWPLVLTPLPDIDEPAAGVIFLSNRTVPFFPKSERLVLVVGAPEEPDAGAVLQATGVRGAVAPLCGGREGSLIVTVPL